MVVYMSEKHLFCTVRKEKKKDPFMGKCGKDSFFKLEGQKANNYLKYHC